MNNFDDLLNNIPTEGQSGQLSKEDYAAKKKAERDAIFELSDDAALHVSGSGEQFRSFLDVQGRFDRYSAVNALLIYAQQESLPNEKETRLGDFDYWKERGGFVKPGQSAISILEPHEYTKEDGSAGTGYNIKKVFDISQVDARKVKINPPPSITDRQLLSALISKAPMKISGIENLSGDLGVYTDNETGEIFVRKGMEFADTFRSVAQELCYAEAEKNGNNTIDPMFTAYCGAYVLCKKYCVDTKSFDFKYAPELFRGFEAQDVKKGLSAVHDAANSIAGRMAKQLDAIQKAAKNQEAR